MSTDGFGSLTNSGTITANVPLGATVTAAYLYSAYYTGPSFSPSVTLNGSAANFTSNTVNATLPILGAARADVTSLIAPTINGGSGGTYSFAVNEVNGTGIDGEALVVVYSQPSLPTTTVAILDGYSALTGDKTAINFANPLDPTAADFQAELRLGDGYSCCDQASTITVNATQITASAGNNDDSKDAVSANGNLITVGGSNDPFSPFNPTYTNDHERYNLVPYIKAGDTSIQVTTLNPSNDDNIFLAVFSVSGVAGVNAPPPTDVPGIPEPSTVTTFGIGLLGLGLIGRRSWFAAAKQADTVAK